MKWKKKDDILHLNLNDRQRQVMNEWINKLTTVDWKWNKIEQKIKKIFLYCFGFFSFKIYNLRVFWVTSNSFATKYRLLGGPLAKNNEPRSACVSRPTLTRILWHNTSMSNSLATSRINSINSSPSSNSIKCRRLSNSEWLLLDAEDKERFFYKKKKKKKLNKEYNSWGGGGSIKLSGVRNCQWVLKVNFVQKKKKKKNSNSYVAMTAIVLKPFRELHNENEK